MYCSSCPGWPWTCHSAIKQGEQCIEVLKPKKEWLELCGQGSLVVVVVTVCVCVCELGGQPCSSGNDDVVFGVYCQSWGSKARAPSRLLARLLVSGCKCHAAENPVCVCVDCLTTSFFDLTCSSITGELESKSLLRGKFLSRISL